MKNMPVDFLGLFVALNQGNVRYVLVGGLAVVLHGVDRITADVDLAIDLTPASVSEFIMVLAHMGFRPMLPVDPKQFADPEVRKAWSRERRMQVFSFWDPSHQHPSVDVFVDDVLPFDELWRDSRLITLENTTLRIASIDHLIRLKTIAGRPQDLADIARLREVQSRERKS